MTGNYANKKDIGIIITISIVIVLIVLLPKILKIITNILSPITALSSIPKEIVDKASEVYTDISTGRVPSFVQQQIYSQMKDKLLTGGYKYSDSKPIIDNAYSKGYLTQDQYSNLISLAKKYWVIAEVLVCMYILIISDTVFIALITGSFSLITVVVKELFDHYDRQKDKKEKQDEQ